jgi:hypothetical protein
MPSGNLMQFLKKSKTKLKSNKKKFIAGGGRRLHREGAKARRGGRDTRWFFYVITSVELSVTLIKWRDMEDKIIKCEM